MRDQELRRQDRHDAEQAGCHHPGDDGEGHHHGHHGHHGERSGEDEGRRSRGGGRRGPARDGFPGGPPGFGGFPGFAGSRGFRGGPGGPGDFPGPGPRGGPRRRGLRARRGDVRAAALALLSEQPMNGYQIIQEIGERSGGVWRPSPGSVYPALQQLQDEGLIQAGAAQAGHRGYVLTDSGRQYAADHAEELRAPWDVVAGGPGGPAIELRSLMGQLGMAAFQVASAGTAPQQARAAAILADSRTALYRILADGQDDAGRENQAGAQAEAGSKDAAGPENEAGPDNEAEA